MNQLRQSQTPPPEPAPIAPFSVRLVTATGVTFTLCGSRPPAQAGADLLRDALAVSRAPRRLAVMSNSSTPLHVGGSNGANC